MVARILSVVAVLGFLVAATGSLGGERPLSDTIRAAADAVRPAVVSIEVKGRREAGPRELPEWPFGRGRQGIPREWRFEWQWPPREGQPRVLPFPFGGEDAPFAQLLPRGPAEGSGLVLEVEGERALVAAPRSLVADADAVTVKLPDGRQLAAKVLGTDQATGLACLEVKDPKLVAAKAAKADALQVGDWVLAIGGPEADGAVTIGIVSTKQRPGQGELAGVQLFYADITLTPGMAGSPLVNLNGEVVGTAIAPRQMRQGRELAAFVPFDTVQSTARALAKEGKVRRAFLGISFEPVDREDQKRLGIDHGVLVTAVYDGYPASKAGMKMNDVILEFDGRKVNDPNAFQAMVAGKRAGELVTLKLNRGGKETIVEVTLAEAPPEDQTLHAPEARGRAWGEPQELVGEKLDFGLSVQPLTPDLAAAFGFEGDKGLLVSDVAPDSPAAKARPNPIARGDLLKEVARKPVATVADAKAAIEEARKSKEKTVLMLVRSKDGARYVVVDIAP